MLQLYRCKWLTDLHRSSISCIFAAMLEKMNFMGVSDMPLPKNFDSSQDETSNEEKTRAESEISNFRANENNSNYSEEIYQFKTSLDAKHDTRIVNESFQDSVMLLEEGFGSKMQAEMLVLVDVLHKPAAIFPVNSAFRIKAQDKRFIGK